MYLCLIYDFFCKWEITVQRFSAANMQIWLLEMVFLFFSKLAKWWEQLSWLVKKEHFSQKIKFLKRFISFKYTTIYASFNANKSWGALILKKMLKVNKWNKWKKSTNKEADRSIYQ